MGGVGDFTTTTTTTTRKQKKKKKKINTSKINPKKNTTWRQFQRSKVGASYHESSHELFTFNLPTLNLPSSLGFRLYYLPREIQHRYPNISQI